MKKFEQVSKALKELEEIPEAERTRGIVRAINTLRNVLKTMGADA